MNNTAFGMVHIYTGDGKGKTTAGIGLCCRCAGRGGKVLVTAFLKDFGSGEYMFPAPFDVFGKDAFHGFWSDLSENEKQTAKQQLEKKLTDVFALAKDKGYDMLLLDEVLFAAHVGAVDIKLLKSLILSKPTSLELVMTGRCCDKELYEISDYVSEIKAVKHPYSSGTDCRIGIEK